MAAASRATREQRRQLEEFVRAREEAERATEAARKTVRRTRAAALVFFVLLAAAIAGPFIASRRATIGAKRIEADSAFHLALQKLASEEPAEGLAYLAHVVRNDPHNDAARVLLYEQFLTRSWPVPLRTFGPERRMDAAAFTDDGTRVAFQLGQSIEAWDVAQGQRIGTLAPRFRAESIGFAGDNRTLIIETTHRHTDDPKQVLLWNVQTNQTVTIGDVWSWLGTSVLPIGAVDVSADGKELAVEAPETVVNIIPIGGGTVEKLELSRAARKVRFAPDSRFVIIDSPIFFAIWDRRLKLQQELNWLGDFVTGFSRDGKKVLTTKGGDVTITTLEGGKTSDVQLYHPSPAIQGAFDASGQRIVTIAQDYGVRVWDAEHGKPLYDPLWHYEPVHAALFTGDGARVLTRSARLVRWWDASSGKGLAAPIVEPKSLAAQAIDRGSNLAVISDAARVWTVPTVVLPPAALNTSGDVIELSPDRKTAIVRQFPEFLLVAFDTESGQRLWTAKSEHPIGPPASHPTSPMNVGGDMIDARTGQPLLANGSAGTISEDSSAVAYPKDGPPPTFTVLSMATGKPIGPPIEASAINVRVYLSGGGARLAVNDHGLIKVLDVRSHRLILEVHEEESASVDLSADGQRLVTVSPQQGVRVWDVNGGAAQTIEREGAETWAAFAPDGRRLAVMTDDDVALCDAESLRCRPETLAHANVKTVEFSADGARVMTASEHEIRVWDVATGRPLSPALPLQIAPDAGQPFGLARDGSAVLGVSDRFYRVPLPLKVSDDDAERLADLAEALSGVRVVRLGKTERIHGRQKLDDLAKRCGSISGLACDVVRWMRTPQAQRTISPVSKMKIGDYVKMTLRPDNEEHLRALFPNEPALAGH